MATTIYTRNTLTHPGAIPQNGYFDMLTTGSGVQLTTNSMVTAPAEYPGEKQFALTGVALAWWSPRVAAPVTISGSMTFNIWINGDAGYVGLARVRLFKITAGGSAIESLIATATTDAMTATNAIHSVSVTPSTPVVLSVGERLILRVYLVTTTGNGTLKYNSTTTNLVLAETVTFTPNGTKLYLRSTTTIGIASFMDLSETIGTGVGITATVNTSAGATQVQWTKTAGGAIAEWISQRIKAPGWTAQLVANFVAHFYSVAESSLSANCGFLYKVFKRRPDGTETLVYTRAVGAELTTTPTTLTLTGGGTLAQVTNFAEDDRVVVRVYIENQGGTMGGGFNCSLMYDGGGVASPDVTLLDSPEFKLSTDPAGSSSVPGAMTTGGVGN